MKITKPYQISLFLLAAFAITASEAITRTYYSMPFSFKEKKHISDLDSEFSVSELEAMADRWSLTTTRKPPEKLIDKCENSGGRFKFLGGIGIFGNQDTLRTSYSVAQGHHSIAYTLSLKTFNWDSSDQVILRIASQVITIPIPSSQNDLECKPTHKTRWISVKGKFPHSTNEKINVIIESKSSKSTLQAGLAISDLQLLAYTSSEIPVATISHQICPNGICPAPPSAGCEIDRYFFDNICQSCGDCASCFIYGSSHSDKMCASCQVGMTFDGKTCIPLGNNWEEYRGEKKPEELICINQQIAQARDAGNEVYEYRCSHECAPGQLYSIPAGAYGSPPRLCLAKCPTGKYMSANFTCIDNCNPLMVNKTDIGTFCNFPCINKNDFLYQNGSCLPSCPFEKVVLNPGNYMFCNGGVGLKEVVMNGVKSTLYTFDTWAHAHKDRFEIDKKIYHVDATWAFFGLVQSSPPENYYVQNWDSVFSCGCLPQKCGTDCANTTFCGSTGQDRFSYNPVCLWPWKSKSHYCWNIYSDGAQEFQAYNLSLVSVISMMDFGGDGISSSGVTSGFTITNALNSQVFASNALIRDFETKHPLDDLVFATGEERVVLRRQLDVYKENPNITVDWTTAYCRDHDGYLHRNLIIPKISGETQSIVSYQILYRSNYGDFDSLHRLKILTPVYGVQEWSDVRPFTFIDPCNQMYLDLIVDRNGVFSVKPPGHQKLLVDNIICIAINLDPDNSRNLALYETKVGGSEWKPSDRFTGILSRDWIKRVRLQVTTRSSVLMNSQDDDDDIIHLEIFAESTYPRVVLRTHAPLTCHIHISPNCTLNMTTTTQKQYYFEDIEENCGFWYERIVCQCDGFIGYVYSPNKLVRAPIQGYHLEPTEFFEVSTHSDHYDRSSFWNKFWFTLIILIITTLFYLLIQKCIEIQRKKNKKIQLTTKEPINTEEDELRMNTEPPNSPPILTQEVQRTGNRKNLSKEIHKGIKENSYLTRSMFEN